MNATLALPVHAAGISPDWLTAALAQRFPGVEVTEAKLTEELHGTASKFRMRVTYNAAGREARLPASLIVKGGFSAHREMMAYIYELEMRFYRDLAPRLDVRVPRCFFAGNDADNGQAIVILEDLDAAGARFCRVETPLGYEQAAAQLEALAACHSRCWNSSAFETGGELGWNEPLDP